MPTWDIKKNMPDQTGKVAIVTGGNTGIGRESVLYLALRGAKVYMASRTESRALSSIEELEEVHPEIKEKAGIHFLQLDLASLESCQSAARTFLEKEQRLDILINNAGIMATPYELTKDGFEMQFQSNYLGHFAFTIPLIPLMIQTSKDPNSSVRIVQVSSGGHSFATGTVNFENADSVNREYSDPWQRYGQSRLANILFAKELARRLAGERIWSNALHPGNINTELNRGPKEKYPYLKPLISLMDCMLATTYQGATTPLFAATAEEIEKNDWRCVFTWTAVGRCADDWYSTPTAQARDMDLARACWDLSEKIIKDKTGYEQSAI